MRSMAVAAMLAVLLVGCSTNGSQGDTGPSGPTGATGPAGPVGPTGPVGATGPIGPTGPEGPAGATGPIGPTGPIGATGPIGPQGVAGPAGPQGVAGPTGPTGPAGLTWKGAWDGATAYQADDAVDYDGSAWIAIAPSTSIAPPSAEWSLLASAGATGPQGPTGPQGGQGVAGPTGPEGPTGPQGLQGLIGPEGPIGPTGPAGPIGPTGLTGPAGPGYGGSGKTGYLARFVDPSTLGAASVYDNGNIGIRTSTPAQSLDVFGNANVSGALMTNGTARLDASGNLTNIANITATGSSVFTCGPEGSFALQAGNSSVGTGGEVSLSGGTGGANQPGGDVQLHGGPGGYNGAGGQVYFAAGTGGQSGGGGAAVQLVGGGPNYGAGGGIVLAAGAESAGNWWDPGHHGSVIFQIAGTEYLRIDGARPGSHGNVGIGTATPNAKVQVASGDVYLSTAGKGIIMTAPDGTCWRVTVAAGGALSSAAVPCP